MKWSFVHRRTGERRRCQKGDKVVVGGKKVRKGREGKFCPITIPRHEWVSAEVKS